jgi:glycosyltransferase involved in cell wall biosynthesis
VIISVMIATYARPAGLRKAVRSLDRQTRPPEEIVAVALSRDAVTLQTFEDLGRGRAPGVLPALKPVIVDDPDLGAKENAGILAARGDILCFMDDDAEARNGWSAWRRITVIPRWAPWGAAM